MKKFFFFLFLLPLCSFLSAAETVHVTVNPEKTLNPIDVKVYGHFLEHIYNSCNGGLWGELVWNRSFEAGEAHAAWECNDGVYTQRAKQGDSHILLENADWKDYELTLDAKKLAGKEGFLILFRAQKDSYYWLNLGGWENQMNAVERIRGTEKEVVAGREKCDPIQTGRAYRIRILVYENHIQAFIDGKSVLDVTDDAAKSLKNGGVGLGSWNTSVEYRNVLVRDLEGRVLYDGNKTAASAAENTPVNVRFWKTSGNLQVGAGDARNSDKYLRIRGFGTISQQNFAFETGEIYDYSFWTRGSGSVTFQAVRNAEKIDVEKTDVEKTDVGRNRAEKTDAKAKENCVKISSAFTSDVNSEVWQKVTGTFQVSESTKDGAIQFAFTSADGKTLDADQISIMPRSWKEKYHGMRPDLLNAIKAIQPAVIRWPGGCYASGYRWKDGIGPQDDRGSYPVELWNDKDVNSFGIDEFIALCRYVGAEPIMVVNIGTKQWRWTLRDGVNIDLQEAVDWLEYCNGSTDTKWGAIRAKNGHPDPYNVKFWEIDNEVHPQQTPVDEYVAVCNTLISRMKTVDPNITVIACGSWAGGDRFGWDESVGTRVKGISFISTHQYDNPDGYSVNPYRNQRFFEERRQVLEKSGNAQLRFFDSEWNAQSTDWRTGLHAGGILNCFEKAGDVVGMASPALFLRHTSADGWDNAFINFNHTGWFPAPNYVVMKLWREHYAPNRVELLSGSPEMQGNEPLVNAVATRSEDGKNVYVKVVNNRMEDVPFSVTLTGSDVKNASAQCVTPELAEGEDVSAKLRKRNTLDVPDAISVKPLPVNTEEHGITVTLPSLSATVITIPQP